MEEDDKEDQPLLGDKDSHESNNELRVQPKRTLIVEPLIVLYSLAGMPLMTLRSQFMYQKIASDMGINLTNLSGKSEKL